MYRGTKHIVSVLILLGFALAGFASLPGANDYISQIKDGNEAYTAGDFSSAIEIYELILANGKELPEVHYNLGNAYFRANNIPRAILHYERAKRGANDDEDINYNLKFANLKIVDQAAGNPKSLNAQMRAMVVNYFSLNGWTALLLLALWSFLGSMYYYLVHAKIRTKKKAIYFGLFALGITVLSGTSANTLHKAAHRDKEAIVFAAEVTVKSEPGDGGTDLFVLHPGIKVELMEKVDEWNKIRLSNGVVGWLKDSAIEII